MKITYDKSVDAAYIHLVNSVSPKNLKTDSFEISGIIPFGDLNIDFDDNNKIIGIEILNASRYLQEELLKLANPI